MSAIIVDAWARRYRLHCLVYSLCDGVEGSILIGSNS